MKKCEIFVFLLCFIGLFSRETLEQRRSSSSGVYNKPSEKEYKPAPRTQGTHWKSIAIIILSVIILAAICYGTNCLYICQITLCHGPERRYTKMDLTSQV